MNQQPLSVKEIPKVDLPTATVRIGWMKFLLAASVVIAVAALGAAGWLGYQHRELHKEVGRLYGDVSSITFDE